MKVDLQSLQSTIVTRLPRCARWLIAEVTLDFDFSAAREGLSAIRPDDAVGPRDLQQWVVLRIFGECNFAAGGGARPWLCIRMDDGAVVELDIEHDNPVRMVNSSLERFIEAFNLVNRHLGEGLQLPADIDPRLRAIDPTVYDASYWRPLLEYLTPES